MSKISVKNFAKYIDHTLLRANATEADIRTLCAEAKQYEVYSVCVNPTWIPLCGELLQGSGVLPITVVGFPLGADGSQSKAFTAKSAIEAGAREIDMVIDIGAALDGHWKKVEEDIGLVKKVCGKIPLKVILEISYLNNSQIEKSCAAAKAAGANFVKTSTGFSGSGATLEAVKIMWASSVPQMGVKASGGIKDFKQAEAFIAAGATRLGTSSTVKILGEIGGL